MVGGLWAVIVRGDRQSSGSGQAPLTAVCHGERERRLPATRGGAWRAEGSCVQRTSAAVTGRGTDSSCGARPGSSSAIGSWPAG